MKAGNRGIRLYLSGNDFVSIHNISKAEATRISNEIMNRKKAWITFGDELTFTKVKVSEVKQIKVGKAWEV